jgi:hypothetical protein
MAGNSVGCRFGMFVAAISVGVEFFEVRVR